MTDKIQEELEKGCGEKISDMLICGTRCANPNNGFIYCRFCQGKLSQHLATKQAMIKKIEKVQEDLHSVMDIETTTKQHAQALNYAYGKLEELKGELKI